MAKKGQTFNKYDFDFKLSVVQEKQEGTSYQLLEKKYKIPWQTIAGWIRMIKNDGGLEVKPRGQGNKKDIDYKERYEILKKFQDFLATSEQKKK
jgi:transposase